MLMTSSQNSIKKKLNLKMLDIFTVFQGRGKFCQNKFRPFFYYCYSFKTSLCTIAKSRGTICFKSRLWADTDFSFNFWILAVPWIPMYRVFNNDLKCAVGHGFQKSRFAEILAHYDSSHLSLMSCVTSHLKSPFLLFQRFSSVNYSNSRWYRNLII